MSVACRRVRVFSLVCALPAIAACGGGARPPTGAGGTGGAGGAGGAGQLGDLRRAAAAAGKLIGAAVADGPLRDDAAYAAVLAREFDYVTPENATKWGPLAPAA